MSPLDLFSKQKFICVLKPKFILLELEWCHDGFVSAKKSFNPSNSIESQVASEVSQSSYALNTRVKATTGARWQHDGYKS